MLTDKELELISEGEDPEGWNEIVRMEVEDSDKVNIVTVYMTNGKEIVRVSWSAWFAGYEEARVVEDLDQYSPIGIEELWAIEKTTDKRLYNHPQIAPTAYIAKQSCGCEVDYVFRDNPDLGSIVETWAEDGIYIETTSLPKDHLQKRRLRQCRHHWINVRKPC